MQTLMLQIFKNGVWRDAMRLDFHHPEHGLRGSTSFGYDAQYIADNLDSFESRLDCAVSAQIPLNWEVGHLQHAPAFLQDIVPAGAARRFLLRRLAHERAPNQDIDLFLLSRCTPGPIGNLRVRESIEALGSGTRIGFGRDEVVTRDSRFLEYAYERGASMGGATGAGGEAPKLLLAEAHDGLLYPDSVLPDGEVKAHWFVKFARNRAGETDQDVLRSEFCYYKALQSLGISTVPADGLAFETGEKPSLWMQRFDREVYEEGVRRIAVESIYSLAEEKEPGAYMSHLTAIEVLAELWSGVGQEAEIEDLIADYLQRDLLNQILGNSDNHGRNISVLRTPNGVRLAPIYDLAPMVMDGEGITRTTKWPDPIEVAGEVDWLGACKALAGLVDPEPQYERLRQAAQHFRALPDLLTDIGLPSATMNHPRIALRNLDNRLKSMRLI